jgi:DNA polymerase
VKKMEVEVKTKMMEDLAKEWDVCEKCKLCESRERVVFGDGAADASLMIIGEAPGEVEDSTGTPFQGKTKEIVDDLLHSFGSNREEVFITNVVACRPVDSNGKYRTPNKTEIGACKERLYKIIEAVDPTVLLLLGSTAVKLLTSARSVTSVANDPAIPRLSASIPGQCITVQRDAFATFHPSYIANNPGETEGSPLHRAWETWKKAFAVSDQYNEIYWGVTIPYRE